jgi:hypothetical protein
MRVTYDFTQDSNYHYCTVTTVNEVVETFKRLFRRAGTRVKESSSEVLFVRRRGWGTMSSGWYVIMESGKAIREATARESLALGEQYGAQQFEKEFIGR